MTNDDTVRTMCGESAPADVFYPRVERVFALSDSGVGEGRFLALRTQALLGKVRPHVMFLMPGQFPGGEGDKGPADFEGPNIPPLVLPLPDVVVRTEGGIEATATVGDTRLDATFQPAAQFSSPEIPLVNMNSLVNGQVNLSSEEEMDLQVKPSGTARNFKIVVETTERGKKAHIDKGAFTTNGSASNPIESPTFEKPQAFGLKYKAPAQTENPPVSEFDLYERLTTVPDKDYGKDRLPVHLGPPMKSLPLVIHVYSSTGKISTDRQKVVDESVARAQAIWKQACIHFDVEVKIEKQQDLQFGFDNKTPAFRKALVPGKLDAFLLGTGTSIATLYPVKGLSTPMLLQPIGLTRDHTDAPDNRIIQFKGQDHPNALAHELGHALGLNDRYEMAVHQGGGVGPEPLASGDDVRLMYADGQKMFVLIPSEVTQSRTVSVGQ